MASTKKTPEVVRTVARIRELVNKHKLSQSEVARQQGITPASVNQIINGVRHKDTSIPVNELGLRYSSKNCRRCGEKAGIVTKSLLCIRCGLAELAQAGVVAIQPEG